MGPYEGREKNGNVALEGRIGMCIGRCKLVAAVEGAYTDYNAVDGYDDCGCLRGQPPLKHLLRTLRVDRLCVYHNRSKIER